MASRHTRDQHGMHHVKKKPAQSRLFRVVDRPGIGMPDQVARQRPRRCLAAFGRLLRLEK